MHPRMMQFASAGFPLASDPISNRQFLCWVVFSDRLQAISHSTFVSSNLKFFRTSAQLPSNSFPVRSECFLQMSRRQVLATNIIQCA